MGQLTAHAVARRLGHWLTGGGTPGQEPCGSLGLMNKALHSLSLGLPVLMGASWAWCVGGIRGASGTSWTGGPQNFQPWSWHLGSVAGEPTPKPFLEVRAATVASVCHDIHP